MFHRFRREGEDEAQERLDVGEVQTLTVRRLSSCCTRSDYKKLSG